jgi:uncharacterized lipoprotein YmbA
MSGRAVLLVLLLAGCASGPAPGVYVLSPPAGTAVLTASVASLPILYLQPVTLPDYLDTTDILLRIGPNQLKASLTGRWGERLSRGVTGGLAAAVGRRLPGMAVTTGAPPTNAAAQLQVDIEALDVQPDGRCVLVARWALLSGDGRTTRGSGRGVFEVPAGRGTGDAAVVAAMAEALDRLADRLAPQSQSQSPSPRP